MSGLTFEQTDPDGSGRIVDATGGHWAHALGGNPLAEEWAERGRFDELLAHGERVVIWSGTPADGLFDAHPTIWDAAHAERLDAIINEATERMKPGAEILLRPHARHVVSDVPGCRLFATRFADKPVGVLLDPSSMLEASMLEGASEHLRRFAEAALPVSRAVLVAGVRRSPERDGEVELCEIEKSEVDPARFAPFEATTDRPAIHYRDGNAT